ncbi:MAG: phosphatidylglycerophosphatase A [Deltaproteobacteria bacterium]|nr:phosphatidylglycerophosphatase A [Deltaproteobacteria bacterium]
MHRLTLLLASGLYTGYMPVASGTWGTLVAIPLFWLFAAWQEAVLLTLVTWVAAVAGACWIAGRAETLLGEHDSGVIVIDEIVGYLAATLFLPPTWGHTILAFFVFRALDVLKPFPAGWIDRRMPGGSGVVLDDVVSGLYSNVVTRLLAAWFLT